MPKPNVGNCGTTRGEECGLKDPMQCAIHAPLGDAVEAQLAESRRQRQQTRINIANNVLAIRRRQVKAHFPPDTRTRGDASARHEIPGSSLPCPLSACGRSMALAIEITTR